MTILGKYELLELIGSGATAEVYRARDTHLGRVVAFKVLKPSLVADSSAFQRFIQEARAAALLFHPHIATVLDMGEADGRYFIAMRYQPGQSLDKLLQEKGPLAWEDVIRMARQIGGALDYAHREGFLHRDVKPSNIIRTQEGDYVLTDFGLTRAMMSTGLTSHTGAVLGTPSYIAPEVWLNQPAAPATDQYALACVVVEAITGNVLFGGETPPAVMTGHVLKGAEIPVSLPEGVRSVLSVALAKDASARYGSVSAFADALESSQNLFQGQMPGKEVVAKPETEEEIRHGQVQAAGQSSFFSPVLQEVGREPEPVPPVAPQARQVDKRNMVERNIPLQATMPAGQPFEVKKQSMWVGIIIGLIGVACIAAVVIGAVIVYPRISKARPAPTSTRAPTATPSPAELLIGYWGCEEEGVIEFTRDGNLRVETQKIPYTLIDDHTLGLALPQPVEAGAVATPKPVFVDFEFKIVEDTLTLSRPSEDVTLFCERMQPGEAESYLATQAVPAPTEVLDCSRVDTFCVSLVTDVGGIDDHSYNQAAWDALLQARNDLGAVISNIETLDSKDYASNIAAFAEENYDVIVTASWALGEATLQAASSYPDIRFIGVDQYPTAASEPSNLVRLMFAEDQMGFLAGAMAAQMTRSGKIGAVCGTDAVPPVWRICEGYRAGANYVNPNVEVSVIYHNDVGLDKTFVDPEWGKSQAGAMIDQGVDVIFGAGGKTTDGGFVGAAEKGVYVIGVEIDQYYTLPEAGGAMISSAVKDITSGTYQLIQLARDGVMPSGNYLGTVSLAPFHDYDSQIPSEVRLSLETIQIRLQAGTIQTNVPVSKP